MNPYVHFIDNENKHSLNKVHNSNKIYYSELDEWYTNNAFRSFSIKYVLENEINYTIGHTHHIIGAGKFMLATRQPGVEAFFKSPRTVKSLCIDICPDTIGEVFAVLKQQKDFDPDKFLGQYFKYPDFPEMIYNAANSNVGRMLEDFAMQLRQNNVSVNDEWFFRLVEQIVYQQHPTYVSLNNLKFMKPATKKEIIRRLHAGREFMDEHYLTVKFIREVAMVTNMSEYNFFRSFKDAFGISPYKYLLKKRLQLAQVLISKHEMNLKQIAAHCAFPDLFTFSKAFKRQFGISPSVYRDGLLKQ
ncbi:MAG TPA: helix-turn-helix transcriptional regulator [Chitinophagaceae bacterium]|nr:helix-turn-helix transcriptional regulator [Chitinophagaceae bacterium]